MQWITSAFTMKSHHTTPRLNKYLLILPFPSLIVQLTRPQPTTHHSYSPAHMVTAAPTSTTTHPAPTTIDTASLTQDQPFTVSYLARLATFILQKPRPCLKRVFDTIASLSFDPDSPKPDALTTKTCNSLIRMMKSDSLHSFEASLDTISYALCLLLRFRMVLALDRDDIVSRDIDDATLISIAVYFAYKWFF